MSQPSASGTCKWMEEPVMPMVDGLFASGLINSTTRVKLKEIEPNLKDEFQNRNLKGAKKTSLTEKPATSSSQRSSAPKKISNRAIEQESQCQKRKLLHLNQSSKAAHRKSASPSLCESTSKYLSFAMPPPNFSIQNNENTNINQYSYDSTNISIGIPIDELLLTKKRIIGKREIQRLLSDYIKKINNYNTTIAESQMCENGNDILKDPSFEYKELERMLNITFATWNTAITTIRGYSDEYARLLYEIKKFFQQRVEKFPEIIQKYDEKIANLNSDNNLQKETIEQINAIVTEKDNEIDILKKTIEDLNLKIFRLENDKEQLNTRINDAEYSKEHIEEEYNTAVFRLTRSEEERKKSSQVLQSTQEILESCRSQIAHQEEVIEKYEEEGAGFRPLYTRAAFENQQYIKDLNDLREKMKNMVVKQKTVNVEVQANLIKIANEQKPKRTNTTMRPTKKSTKKIQKQKSSVVVRNMMEKFDPSVLNSTATTTPDKKKKKKKPSSASKQVKKSSIASPSNIKLNENKHDENNNNNKIEDISVPTSVNVSAVASPCLKELMLKNQGILKSQEKFNKEITQCISFDSVSDTFDMSGTSNISKNQNVAGISREQSNANFSRDQSRVNFTHDKSNASFTREQSNVNFAREQSRVSFARSPSNVSFARSPSNVSFSLDQSNNSFTCDSSATKSGKCNSCKKANESQLKSKSHSHLLNKESEHHSKCKSANLSPTLSPIYSQSHENSQIEMSESSSNTSPNQYLFISPIKTIIQSPTPLDIAPSLPPDYNVRQSFDIDSDTLVSCVYRLLPLPLGTSSIFAHQADPEIDNIMNNASGNMGAKLSDSSIVPKYKSYNWMMQRIVDFFHSVLNLDQTSNPYISSVSMLRATIAENTKIGALSDRILQDLIKTALVHKKTPIVSVFLKVVTYEITTSEYKFLNMLFNLAFDFIYPSVQSLLQDPDLSPTSPPCQFLINRTICEEIATKIFKHVEKDALKAVQSIESNSKWPDLIDFWSFALKMISFFTQTHKQFQRQIRAILTLIRLNSQTDNKESINNDNAIITKQNFHDFMIFIRPSIRNKEMEKFYKHFYLECRHRHSNDSPEKRRKILAREFEGEDADISSNTQYNFIRFCTDFPEITEDILVLKCKEDFCYIYGNLTLPLQVLLKFILKRFTDYTKFTQPRLLNPLLDMTRPVLFQMRNALLRCDASMAFSCYRHVLQLIDLKCSEACPFTIFDRSIKIEDVHEVTSLIIAREKIVAAHIFDGRNDDKNKKNESENSEEAQNQPKCEENQVDAETKGDDNKEDTKQSTDNKENAKPSSDNEEDVKPSNNNKKDTKPNTDNKENAKPSPDNKEDTKPNPNKKKDAKPNTDNKENAKPNTDNKENAKPNTDNKEDAKPNADNKEDAKPNADNKESNLMKLEDKKDNCETENKSQQTKKDNNANEAKQVQREKEDKIVEDNQKVTQIEKKNSSKETSKEAGKTKIKVNSPNIDKIKNNNNGISTKENDLDSDKIISINENVQSAEKTQNQDISQEKEIASDHNKEMNEQKCDIKNVIDNHPNKEKIKINSNDQNKETTSKAKSEIQNKEKIANKEISKNIENAGEGNNQDKENNENDENTQNKEKMPASKNTHNNEKSPSKENSQNTNHVLKENKETEQIENQNQSNEKVQNKTKIIKPTNNIQNGEVQQAEKIGQTKESTLNIEKSKNNGINTQKNDKTASNENPQNKEMSQIEKCTQNNNETQALKVNQTKSKIQNKGNIQNNEKNQSKLAHPDKENSKTKEDASNKAVIRPKEKEIKNNENSQAKIITQNKETIDIKNENQSTKIVQHKEISQEKEEIQNTENTKVVQNKNENQVNNNSKNKNVKQDKKANQPDNDEINKNQIKANLNSKSKEQNKEDNKSAIECNYDGNIQDKNENEIEKNEMVQIKKIDSNVKQIQKDNQDKKGKKEQESNEKEKTQTQKQTHPKEDAEMKDLTVNNKSNEINQDKNKTKVNEKNQNKAIDSNSNSLNSNNESGQTNNNNESSKKVLQINQNIQNKQNQSKNEKLEINSNDSTQTITNTENKRRESNKDNCTYENVHSEIDKNENKITVKDSPDDSNCINGTQNMDSQCIDKESNENAKSKNKLSKIMQKFKSNQTKKFVKLSPTIKASPNANKVEVNNEIIKENLLNDDKEFNNDKNTLNTDDEPQQRAE